MAHPRTTSGGPAVPATGVSTAIAGPASTLSRALPVALWPSGFVMVTAFAPPVVLIVDRLSVTDVALLTVTLFTVTPGMLAAILQAKPAGDSKNAEPAVPGVPVTVTSTDGRFHLTDEGATLTGTGGASSSTRAACRP